MKKLRYQLARLVRKIANRIGPKQAVQGITYANIGAERLPMNAPRALVFFAIAGIQRLVEGKGLDDPVFKRHTIHGDAYAMVTELNRAGYIVDYCDLFKVSGKDIDWRPYSLVIDNWDNLRYAPQRPDLIKIAFINGMHWLFHNRAELERIQWFKDRTGIVVPANRQLPSVLSDQHADYLTYYGTQFQKNSFSEKPEKILLNVCSLQGDIPTFEKKNFEKARNKFILVGAGGMIHKGIDLVIEAFAEMPEAEIYIAGTLDSEREFWTWVKPTIEAHPNIKPLGWVDVTSQEFNDIANSCIGVVFASCSEGGPASVGRVLFNGLIPIVTRASNVRAETLGYLLEGSTAQELIESIKQRVREVMSLPEQELTQKSEAVRAFALEHHTREAFTQSFKQLIEHVRDQRI